jgi:hypothetical protein
LRLDFSPKSRNRRMDFHAAVHFFACGDILDSVFTLWQGKIGESDILRISQNAVLWALFIVEYA